MHSSLYFLDFVGADGKRLLVEKKISVFDMDDAHVAILVGTGGANCKEEFYYLSSARVYQVKYEGRDVRKISFRSKLQIQISLD